MRRFQAAKNRIKNKLPDASRSAPNKEDLEFPGMWDEMAWEFLKRLKEQNVSFHHKWSDFDHIKQLGEGGFGKVILSKEKKTGTFMATKIMEKAFIVKMKQIHLATNEKTILFLCHFKFILNLITAYKTNEYVCIGLELAPGGDLFDTMEDTLPFSTSTTRFFASQIILGLQYLNLIKIVYRDLKPENILIAGNGYVKLADFGFAKLLNQSPRTYTFCGTPDYIAPEIILNKGYGNAVDWWSFGVMMYEMLTGATPFYSEDQMKTFKSITRGSYGLPETLTDDSKNIIKNLLQVDTSRRFGNLRNGALDIRYHPFFRLVDWNSIYDQTVEPPFPVKNPDFSKIQKDPQVEIFDDKSPKILYENEFKNF